LAENSGQIGGKIRPLRHKSGPFLISTFSMHLGLRKRSSVFIEVGKYNISRIYLELERVRGEKHTFTAADLFSPASLFAASFELYGRTIGQLATLSHTALIISMIFLHRTRPIFSFIMNPNYWLYGSRTNQCNGPHQRTNQRKLPSSKS
jgi:hypothetical protein